MAHSMCKTLLSMSEILLVLNSSEVDNNLKKSYLVYLTAVYVASPYNATELGTAHLSHSPSVVHPYLTC